MFLGARLREFGHPKHKTRHMGGFWILDNVQASADS